MANASLALGSWGFKPQAGGTSSSIRARAWLQPPPQPRGTTHSVLAVQVSPSEPVPRGALTPGTDVSRQALLGRGGRVGAGLGMGEKCRAAADPSFETSASLSG